jgi:hypothetical protein
MEYVYSCETKPCHLDLPKCQFEKILITEQTASLNTDKIDEEVALQ